MYDAAPENSVDSRALRQACGCFASGVTVVTTRTPQGDHGMTVSAFMSVSLDPPLICVSLGVGSKMVSKVRARQRYAVNVLTQSMRTHALHFAGRPDEELEDLFEDRHGMPALRGAAALLVADVVNEVEAGDHLLLVGQVCHIECDPTAPPLLYHAGQFGGLGA
ncbi:MAG: flavin reductase family protein [Pseudomonadota bacterium]